MNRIIFLLILAISAFISCGDGRAACYAEYGGNTGIGFCEIATILNYEYDKQRGSQTPEDVKAKIFIVCQRQEQIKRKCDNQSEWWPLPKNLNHPSGNENILSMSPEK